MSRIRIKRPTEASSPAPVVSEKLVRRQIGQAAGTEFFQNRDPLYHVTENFQMTFDAIGRRHAAEAVSGEQREPVREGEEREPPQPGEMPDATSARSFYERSTPEEQDQLRRFSETSFQRGTLSGAVLRGTGQMMLFSCLKKTIGQSQPNKWQQRKLFEKVSVHKNSPGKSPDKVLVNRGFTDSAVAIVVDTLRDARRTVEDMQMLATGKDANRASDVHSDQTMRKMYPFLDDSRERQLLEQYQSQLEGMAEGDPQRSILQNAIGRTQALIGKKAQMKVEFINKLRFLSDRATEALDTFTQPDFSQQLYDALQRELDQPPPDDGDDSDGTADQPDDAESGNTQGA